MTVLLLDGNSLAYRAHFALAPSRLTSPLGLDTGALHGFLQMLNRLIDDHVPESLAVAFDLAGPTFRDEVVEDYKAGRDPMPEDLVIEMEYLHRILGAVGIRVAEAEGYEADDVLATLATALRDAGRDVVIVTGDRDAFQLVEDPHVKVLYNVKGVREYVLLDEEGVRARTGVAPADYVLYAAMRGDKSDNLPGVPGVGEKTAAELVNAYGDVDGIYAHLSELRPKIAIAMAEHEERVRRNLDVMRLARDAPVEPAGAGWGETLTTGGGDPEEAGALFRELGIRDAWQRLAARLGIGDGEGNGSVQDRASAGTKRPTGRPARATGVAKKGTGAKGAAPQEGRNPGAAPSRVQAALPADAAATKPVAIDPGEVLVPEGPKAVATAIGGLGTQGAVALWARWSGARGRSPLRSLWIADLGVGEAPGSAAVRAPVVGIAGDLLSSAGAGRSLGALFARARCAGIGLKEIWRSLAAGGVAPGEAAMDVGVAAYLLDPRLGRADLAALSRSILGIEAPGDTGMESAGQGRLPLEREVDGDAGGEAVTGPDAAAEAARALEAIAALAGELERRLDADGMERLHRDIERPLVGTLARMEVAGVLVDRARLRDAASKFALEAHELEGKVRELAGHDFNVNSTVQLRTVLYDELKLTPGKRTKTGYSTDAATLEKLRGAHPVVDALLAYREVEKLRSTYGEPLLAEVGEDDRIHATFTQTVAATGRLSSESPNLHNIPVRTAEGAVLREAFVAPPGSGLLVADYDQIELRVIAHLSEDAGLLGAFREGRDVHRMVAARVFGVGPEEVTPAQRNRAKMVSYGLAYGMEAYGLAERLAIARSEAAEILKAYFAAFPSVRAFMEAAVTDAQATGYTVTPLGRRRPIGDLASGNRAARSGAERQAMNAGVQGFAADIFKIALVGIDAGLQKERFASRLVLQVHDEVLVEVPLRERERATDLVVTTMEQAYELRVPLAVHVAWGASWAEAKAGEGAVPSIGA